jgi:tRNA1Val (adenine37-N6)-methyltransferase
MSHNNYFQFKQFRIIQEKAAMKVNTDGVLLGAWVDTGGVKTVLDIGTGTGVIALMIAQRCDAIITGVEIEKNAAKEALQNIQNSHWGHRIDIQNVSFQEFASNSECKFDLIVSNPPFFTDGVKNTDPNLSMARHNHMLPFADIIAGAAKLLNENGKLAVILPFALASDFIGKARSKGLFVNRNTEIAPFSHRAPNRSLLEFGRKETTLINAQMSVFDDSKTKYSGEFVSLTREFYLKH